MPKNFQENTKYAKHDLDGDGVITDDEIAREKELIELDSAGFDLSLTGLTENFSFDFEPNLNPETTYEEITSVDVDKAAERVGNVGESSAKKTNVICPECGHDFDFYGI